jgi:RNA polymerase sigma factor (sigma-70 family)|uniref:RNA polymerase sigma factor n=1 Tax=Siphoviridae sp. ctEJj1 TaxID=2825395 RepID=A0A8S5U6E8_9CAUD|nr:MAG TPA: RNA polymerase sigma factor [Siphoviridae sp. ctEJj1]
MKIKYEFVDGDVELEVSDEWASVLAELDRLERNNDKKEKRRHYSLEARTYEGAYYAVEDKGISALFEGLGDAERLNEALTHLSSKQQALIRDIYFEGISVSKYADIMGISQPAISQQLKTVYKKLKKFL